jgi:hypothetical protein
MLIYTRRALQTAVLFAAPHMMVFFKLDFGLVPEFRSTTSGTVRLGGCDGVRVRRG